MGPSITSLAPTYGEYEAFTQAELELPAGAKLRVTAQWREAHDPEYMKRGEDPYQEPLARRMFESVIIGDGAMLTALFSRQSGKTETVANTISTLMIMLPRLAKAYPTLLGKFERGVWVGVFAPVERDASVSRQPR